MIGYVTLGSNDLDKARAFYDQLMPVLGAGRMLEFGDNFTMYGTGMGKPGIAVCKPYDGNPATVGNGNMAAIACDTRDRVDALYNKAIELGGTDEGPPGLRGDEGPQAFYGAYFRDLDGNKLCAFRIGPAAMGVLDRVKNAVTIINKGGGSAGENAEERVRSALAKAGIDSDVVAVEAGRCADHASDCAASGAQLVIAAGGDGTIGTVAGRLAGTDVTMGILPLGTLNHFARDLGIPVDLEEAATLIASGKERRVDVAEVNGTVFINNSAIGLYPLMVIDRDAQRRKLGRSKWLALLFASARTLARFNHQRLQLTINDRPAEASTPLLFVGNNDYRLQLPAAGSRDSLTDGKLCVLVMRSRGRAGFVAATIRALLGRTRGDDMARLDNVQTLRVDSRRSSLPVALDGETNYMTPPLSYRIRPGALKVIAP